MLFTLLFIAHHDAIIDWLEVEDEYYEQDADDSDYSRHAEDYAPKLVLLISLKVFWVR